MSKVGNIIYAAWMLPADRGSEWNCVPLLWLVQCFAYHELKRNIAQRFLCIHFALITFFRFISVYLASTTMLMWLCACARLCPYWWDDVVCFLAVTVCLQGAWDPSLITGTTGDAPNPNYTLSLGPPLLKILRMHPCGLLTFICFAGFWMSEAWT